MQFTTFIYILQAIDIYDAIAVQKQRLAFVI